MSVTSRRVHCTICDMSVTSRRVHCSICDMSVTSRRVHCSICDMSVTSRRVLSICLLLVGVFIVTLLFNRNILFPKHGMQPRK